MDKIMSTLDSVYKTISSISVSGDAVDAMAFARAQLRKAYSELEKMKGEENADGHGV